MANTIRVLALVATLAVFAIVDVYGNQYCNVKCSNKQEHTLCTFGLQPRPARRCGKVYSAGLTGAEKADILQLHNKFRRFVASGQESRGGGQPRARDLGDMAWSDELSEIAQAWANQCDFNHDKCRNSEDQKIGYVGQNIASAGSTAEYPSVIDVAQVWYDEVDAFRDHRRINAFTSDPPGTSEENQTGHYTQIVWAKSTRLGCGAIRYDDGEYKNTFVVCNYGPGGNIIGRPIYQIA